MDITTPDPLVDLYRFEETENNTPVEFKWHRKSDVEFADRIIAFGKRDTVKTEEDWGVISELFKFFIKRFPAEWADFEKNINDVRRSRNPGGYSKTKEIQYLASIPLRFERMIRTVFPFQQFDKKFVNSLVKRYKILKVAKEGN